MKPFKPFRFLDWKVYKDAQKIFFKVNHIAKQLPREYRFEIGSQMIRSSLSVVLNIAEGSGKFPPKETARFLDIAMGSLYEVLATLDTITKDPIIPITVPQEILENITEVGRQLGGLRKSVLTKKKGVT